METCERSTHRSVATGFIWAAMTAFIVWQGVVVAENQAKVRETNERLFRIVHGSPVATIMCDENGKVVEYNRAAEEMFGWTRGEVLGQDVDMMIAPTGRAKHAKAFHAAIEQLKVIDEDWKITRVGLHGEGVGKDGKEFPVLFATRGIKYSGKVEFVATMRKDAAAPEVKAGPLDFPKK